jgi:alpha-beta hydrolase superfamily lysophospholipase
LVSHSLGGLVSLKLASQCQNEYAGLGLIAPYLGLKDPSYYDKYKKAASVLNWVMPTYKIKAGSPYPDWLKHFAEDPLYQG